MLQLHIRKGSVGNYLAFECSFLKCTVSKLWKIKEKSRKFKKTHFLVKRPCGFCVITLEPTSPAALRRSRDTERSDDLEGFERSEVENLRHYERAALVV